MQKDNLDQVLTGFLKHLDNKGVSSSTIKNYKSDVVNFSNWFILTLRRTGIFANNLTDAVPMLNQSTSKEYKEYLEYIQTPVKTLNRRLSSLRQLSSFLLEFRIISFDFAGTTTNIIKSSKPSDIDLIIAEFKRSLAFDKTSKNTIKNYVSDVKQFFNWLETQNN